MTWRNHTGLVEMSSPLASIYTASNAGIHHLHITTPPRLVGDRTSGFVQSLTDSPSQDNKTCLRFREGRCWMCQHCFYRAEQQTTQGLSSPWHIFISIPYPTNFFSGLASFVGHTHTSFGTQMISRIPELCFLTSLIWKCGTCCRCIHVQTVVPLFSGNLIKPHFADAMQASCSQAYGALQCNYHGVWTIYRKLNKELKPLPFSLIKLSTVQQRLICVFYPITVNIFRPNDLIRGPDGWS